MRLKLLASIVLIGFAGAAAAQEAKPAFEFALHGFVSATLSVQDNNTNGSPAQGAFSASSNYTTDRLILTGDVRQTRLNFSVKGPQVLGDATPKGIVEVDFFGMNQLGNTGAPGGFGEQSVIPRLRYAYVELAFANSTFWLGQQNDLLFALSVPTSLTHIANPLGYYTGNIGWRSPSIFGFHRFGDADMKSEFAWEVGAGNWNFAAAPTSGANNYITPGSASALPKVELRYSLTAGKTFMAWVGGHWNRLDLNGPNAVKTSCDTGTACSTKDALAGAFGLRLAASGFTLQGAGWYGKNTGGLLGNLQQFTPYTDGTTANQNYVGDLFGWGAWVQAGFNFTSELSLWYMFGSSQILDWEYARTLVTAAGTGAITRMRNNDNVLLLQYRDGGWAMGIEWANFFTTTRASATATEGLHANQWALTSNYYF